MIEDLYFLDEGKVNITSASVGISKLRWKCILEEEDNGQNHIKIMKEGRYDHLPIIPKNGLISEYYKTKIPDNFENIDRHKISYQDVLPLDTKIEIVIEKFYKEKRTFYFLNYNKNISGLITLGNLNCKQVQVYIFSLICELENELALFLNHHLSHSDINNWLQVKSKAFEKANQKDECKINKYKDILTQYTELVENGLENSLTENLFLVDFFNIICDQQLFTKLSYSRTSWEKLYSINNLRNKIAHPTRSLLDSTDNIDKLWKRLLKVKELLFNLQYHKNKEKY